MAELGPTQHRQQLHVVQIAVLASQAQVSRFCQLLAAAITAGDGADELATTMIVYNEPDLPLSRRAELLDELEHKIREPPAIPTDRAATGAVYRGAATGSTRQRTRA